MCFYVKISKKILKDFHSNIFSQRQIYHRLNFSHTSSYSAKRIEKKNPVSGSAVARIQLDLSDELNHWRTILVDL